MKTLVQIVKASHSLYTCVYTVGSQGNSYKEDLQIFTISMSIKGIMVLARPLFLSVPLRFCPYVEDGVGVHTSNSSLGRCTYSTKGLGVELM